jgi:hypothetical protein
MAVCGNCMQNTLEGKLDEKGVFNYRCQYCVDHQIPNAPNPCPKCGCTSHENTCISVDDTNEGMQQLDRWVKNPIRPDVEKYMCLNCSYEWYTPDFEEYLFAKLS